MFVKPDTGSPFVTVACILARYLLLLIDRNVNFFGFYEFNLDYDRNLTEKNKKTQLQTNIALRQMNTPSPPNNGFNVLLAEIVPHIWVETLPHF